MALIIFVIPACKKDNNITHNFSNSNNTTSTIKDNNGNVYHKVTIGTQTWMLENLKTTKCNDGSSIANILDNTEWDFYSKPAYCWYNDSIKYKDTYGALYNWCAVNSGKLCPLGWHVPSYTEWHTLIHYLGDTLVAGSKIKEKGNSYWISPNTDATNSSGFTGLPGGYRYAYGGEYGAMGYLAYWWTSTHNGYNGIWSVMLYNYKPIAVLDDGYDRNWGFSVRCIKDN